MKERSREEAVRAKNLPKMSDEEVLTKLKRGMNDALDSPPTHDEGLIPRPFDGPKNQWKSGHYGEILTDEIPVDADRTIKKFYDPYADTNRIVAVKSARNPTQPVNEMAKMGIENSVYDIPKLEDDVISELVYDKDGFIEYRSSTYSGAKERAGDRLLVEVAKEGVTPYSPDLSLSGRKSLERTKERMDDSNFLDSLKKLKKTGKLGKLWSALPFIGAGATAYSVLNSPSAEAAADEVLSEFDPFGIALPDKVNVGDDAPYGGVPESEMRQRYLESLRNTKDK